MRSEKTAIKTFSCHFLDCSRNVSEHLLCGIQSLVLFTAENS